MSMMISPYGTVAGPFAPNSLTSLVAWYDAQRETAGAMTVWANRSPAGSAYDAPTTGAAAARPNLVANAVNGKNAVSFVNSTPFNQSFTVPSSANLMNGATQGSFFAVFQVTVDPSVQPACSGLACGFTTQIAGAGGEQNFVPLDDGVIYENFGTTAYKTVGNPTPSLSSSFRLYSAHSATNDYRVYLDATSIYSDATNTVGFGTGERRIGRTRQGVVGGPGDNFSFSGFMAEVAIYDDVLSTSDRQKMEGYLAWRYGLQANLPGGHPYLSAPP